MKKIKVIFMGTPQFAVPVLEKLIEKTNVVAVVTQPDKAKGRHQKIEYSPIKKVAIQNDIQIFQPIKIRNDFQAIIALKPDIIITCAYGQIIPQDVLATPPYGCINVHASLLPKLRGGSPIHHAIINGYEETGITIMYMDEKMDNGDIISQKAIPIEVDDNVETLHDKLSIIGSQLLLSTLPEIIKGTNKRIKQNLNEVTYAYNIKSEDEFLDFNNTSLNIYNKIRGLNPFPGSRAILDNKSIKIYESKIGKTNNFKALPGEIINVYKDGIGIKTSDGEIIITKIQIAGKQKMLVKDYLNGINKELLLNQKFI
jgi:methionyl-tRNA formyltransferase